MRSLAIMTAKRGVEAPNSVLIWITWHMAQLSVACGSAGSESGAASGGGNGREGRARAGDSEGGG